MFHSPAHCHARRRSASYIMASPFSIAMDFLPCSITGFAQPAAQHSDTVCSQNDHRTPSQFRRQRSLLTSSLQESSASSSLTASISDEPSEDEERRIEGAETVLNWDDAAFHQQRNYFHQKTEPIAIPETIYFQDTKAREECMRLQHARLAQRAKSDEKYKIDNKLAG